MTNDLHLIDVSAFVHAGRINKYAKFERLVEEDMTWKTQVTPAGGVSLIFNLLYDIVGKGDIIACCDRNPVIKKEMIPGYKGNREHKIEVEVNKNVAEYILNMCDVMTVACDGYEADDIIYTYTKRLYNLYDHIYVYTSDSDLYFLVDDKVEIRPSSTRAKLVTKENYAKTPVHGATWLYNAISVDKVVNGDASDCIPPLPEPLRTEAANLFFIDKSNVDKYGDKEFILEMVKDYPAIIEQINRVWPLLIDDLPTLISTPDKRAICNWGAAMHNKFFKGKGTDDFDVELEVSLMQAQGMYLEDVI